VNWALWPETLLKRKPAFKKYTLESLQKSAIRNAKGPTDFGCVLIGPSRLYLCPSRWTLMGASPVLFWDYGSVYFLKARLQFCQIEMYIFCACPYYRDKWYETAFSHACTMLATRPLSPLGQHVAYDSMMRRLLSRLRFQVR
jgi:hypothetical protein